MVGALAGLTLALVPEREVRQQSWTGEGQPLIPRVVFTALSASGRPLILNPVPVLRSELAPLLEGREPGQAGLYAAEGGELLEGRTLEQASQGALQLSAERTVALGVTLEVPREFVSEMESSAVALLPRNGSNRDSAAPDVNFCLQWPQAPPGTVHVTLPLLADQPPADPYPLLQQALIPPETRAALGLDWVAGPLAREGFTTADSLAALNRFRQRPVPPEQMLTPEGRRQFAAGYLLAQGITFHRGTQLFGHEAMERLKTAVFHQSPAPLAQPDGTPVLPPEAIVHLYPAMEVKTGRQDPFRDIGQIKALGPGTPADSVRTLADFLAPQPRRPDSSMDLFESVVDRHKQRSELADTSPETSLGALKKTSDELLRLMGVSRKVERFSLGIFKIPDSEAEYHKEQRINQLLGELVQAASQPDERPLVELVAQG